MYLEWRELTAEPGPQSAALDRNGPHSSDLPTGQSPPQPPHHLPPSSPHTQLSWSAQRHRTFGDGKCQHYFSVAAR